MGGTQRTLEDGSYWHARPEIRTLALATHPRLGAESLLHQLPLDALIRVAQMLKRDAKAPAGGCPWG